MSIKKWLLALILPLGLVLSAYIFSDQPAAEKPLARNFLRSSFTSKGVVNRLVHINLHFDNALTDSEKVIITAEVSMPFDFNEKLHYRWKLGQDVNLIEGAINGEISGLKKNEPHKIYLTVTGFSQQNNHHIGFEIFGIKDGKNVYGDALIASDLENTFENTVQNVEKIKASE